jgi:hypothetical protein
VHDLLVQDNAFICRRIDSLVGCLVWGFLAG